MSALSPEKIQQIKEFSDCFILHPQVKTVFSDFDDLRNNRQFQRDQQCMLLTGDTGVGKTHLIEHYKKQVEASQAYSREKMPILITRISSNRGLESTLCQILADLELFGSELRKKRGYKVDLTRKVVNSLVRAEVELLIFNEFQELIEFKTIKERQIIANALKFISEEANVPIVLVGMPWAEQIAEEPQWSSRLVRRRKLEYFNLLTDPKYFLQYLMGLARKMPFSEPPKLEDKHIATALFAACRGENRALKHLLTEALKAALAEDADNITIEHLSNAYNKTIPLDSTHPENPFTLSLEKIKLAFVESNSRYQPNAMTPEDMLVPREFSKPLTLLEWQNQG